MAQQDNRQPTHFRSATLLGILALAIVTVAAAVVWLISTTGVDSATTVLFASSDRSNDGTGWEIADGGTDCFTAPLPTTVCTVRINEDIDSGSPDTNRIQTESTDPTNDTVTFEITDFPSNAQVIPAFRVRYRALEVNESGDDNSTLRVEIVNGATVLGSPPTHGPRRRPLRNTLTTLPDCS